MFIMVIRHCIWIPTQMVKESKQIKLPLYLFNQKFILYLKEPTNISDPVNYDKYIISLNSQT